MVIREGKGMVISKKVMRSKRGERERQAVREVERTGGQ